MSLRSAFRFASPLVLALLCGGMRMDRVAKKMTDVACPENAMTNTKGDCVDESNKQLPSVCCQCSQELKDALTATDERLNLYMADCEVQRNDLKPGGKGVNDNTRICADKCQAVEALKQPLHDLISDSCKGGMSSEPTYENYVMLSQVVQTLDSAWTDCTTTTTAAPTTTEAPTTTKPTRAPETTKAPTPQPTPEPGCHSHEDCGPDAYCAKGQYHTGDVYQKCDPVAECSKYNDAIDRVCPGTTLPPTTATTTTIVELFDPIPADDKNTVFVVDISGSMSAQFCDPRTGCDFPHYVARSRLDLVKYELERAIDELSSYHNFMIIAFDNRVHKSSMNLIPATDFNKWAASLWIQNLVTFGGNTQYQPALRAALERVTKIDAIHFLSDGLASDCHHVSCMPLSATYYYWYNNQRYYVTQNPKVHTTLFMPGDEYSQTIAPRDLLRSMADFTGGVFKEPFPAERKPFSVEGCACMKNWGYVSAWIGPVKCNNYCCNPDHEPHGDWCFFENENCLGQWGTNWGYCA